MDLFKLIGSIFIKNDDANKQIDDTASKAKTMGESLGKSMETAGKKITAVGKAITPISVATGAMLTGSVKGASDFTDAMAKMSTLFDTTQTSVEDLSGQFLDLSNKTGMSATELAEAGYQALSAGRSVEEVGGFVETASNLARAGFTSTTTAVDVLTTAMNAYGAEAGTAEEISNKLVRTQNLGKTTVDELANSMGRIIPTASAMGVNIDNLTSGYVSLTKQGIATSEATTYLNGMLNELGDSGTTLGGIIKEKTGKSFQDCMDSGMSLADVLQITKDYADENHIAYNELWGSMEAGKAGLAILNGGVEEFNSTVETMGSDVDDVGSALEKLETPSVKAQRSLNKVKNSGIDLGTTILTSLAPTIDKVCDLISQATAWFNDLDPSVQTNIATVLALVTALGPVLVVGGKIIAGVGAVIGFVGPIVSGIGAVLGSVASLQGALFLLGSILTGPVGIVAGIVAVIGAGVGLATHWDEIKEKAGQLKDGVVQAWDTMKENTAQSVGQFKEDVVTGFEDLKEKAVTKATELKDKAVGKFEELKSKGISKATDLKDKAVSKFEDLKAKGTSKLEDLRAKAISKFEDMKSNTVSKTTDLKDKAVDKFEDLKSKATDKIEKLKGNVKGKVENIKGFFTGLNASDMSKKFGDVKDKVTEKMNKMKSKVEEIIQKIKSKFNITLPSPKIKLPHPSISGRFSLDPPSVPHFSVRWYKKAMEDPYLMTKPTVFGINPMTGQAKAGGEAGDEMIYGRQNLLNDIRQSVESGNTDLVDALDGFFDKLFGILEMYLPNMGSDIYLDGNTLVGKTAVRMDEELGRIYARKART